MPWRQFILGIILSLPVLYILVGVVIDNYKHVDLSDEWRYESIQVIEEGMIIRPVLRPVLECPGMFTLNKHGPIKDQTFLFLKHPLSMEAETFLLHLLQQGPQFQLGYDQISPREKIPNANLDHILARHDYPIQRVELYTTDSNRFFVVLETREDILTGPIWKGDPFEQFEHFMPLWVLIESDNGKLIVRISFTKSFLVGNEQNKYVIADEGRGTTRDVYDFILSFTEENLWKIKKGIPKELSKTIFNKVAKSKKWEWHWIWDWVYYSHTVLATPLQLFNKTVGLRTGMHWTETIAVYDYGHMTNEKILGSAYNYKCDDTMHSMNNANLAQYMKQMTERNLQLNIYAVFLFKEPVNEKVPKISNILSDTILYHTFVVFSMIESSNAYCYYRYYVPYEKGAPAKANYLHWYITQVSKYNFYYPVEIQPDQWVSFEKNGKEITMQRGSVLLNTWTDVIEKYQGTLRRPRGVGTIQKVKRENNVEQRITCNALTSYNGSGDTCTNAYSSYYKTTIIYNIATEKILKKLRILEPIGGKKGNNGGYADVYYQKYANQWLYMAEKHRDMRLFGAHSAAKYEIVPNDIFASPDEQKQYEIDKNKQYSKKCGNRDISFIDFVDVNLIYNVPNGAELFEMSYGRGNFTDFLEFLKSSNELENAYFIATQNCQKFSQLVYNYLARDNKWA